MLRTLVNNSIIVSFVIALNFNSLGADKSIQAEVDSALQYLKIDIGKCQTFTMDLLEKSKDADDYYGIIKSNYILGYLSKKEGDLGKSILYYLEGIRYAKDANYDGVNKDLINLFQNTGNIFGQFGNYEFSKKYYSEAMEIALLDKDFQKYSYLIYLTARSLKSEEKYEEAADLLKTTFPYFNRIKKSTVADIYNQLGLIYTEMGNKDLALNNFQKLLRYVEKSDIRNKYSSWTHHNLGNLFFANNDFDSAIHSYKNAIEFKNSINARASSLFISYKDLSEALIKLNRFDEAASYLKIAESLFENSKSVDKHYEIYKFQSIVSKEKGNMEEYVHYQNLYSNSLENYLAEQRQIEAADKKYNLDLITQRYYALVAEQERNQQIKYYSSVGGSFLVTLIILIIFFFQYRKYRLRKDLEVSLKPYIKNSL